MSVCLLDTITDSGHPLLQTLTSFGFAASLGFAAGFASSSGFSFDW
jgi:hypothetical protein